MTNEKQIEEMARVIYETNPDTRAWLRYGRAKKIATDLYNAGYRKLPENAVVLTKTGIAERWIDLLTEFDEMGFEPTTLPPNDMSVEEYTAFYKARLLEFLAKSRKETAREIFAKIFNDETLYNEVGCGSLDAWDYGNIVYPLKEQKNSQKNTD